MYGVSWGLPVILYFLIAPISYFANKDSKSPEISEKLQPWMAVYFRLIYRVYFAFYIVGSALIFKSLGNAATVDAAFLIFSLGIVSIFSFMHMHELSHSLFKIDKCLSKVAMVLIGYGHFSREDSCHHHNEGNVGMGHVAEKSETVYSFVAKHIPMGIYESLLLERSLLVKEGKSDLHNSIIQNYILSFILAIVIQDLFGNLALFGYVFQSVFCIFFVSVISYIQHYGLAKIKFKKIDEGIAWEYDGFFANLLSLNIMRHSFHHLKRHIPYYFNHIQQNSPKLPFGYVVLVFVALIPPLWFKMMNGRLSDYLEADRYTEIEVDTLNVDEE